MKDRFDSKPGIHGTFNKLYTFVKKFVRGKIMLDLGCGMGDGTYEVS